MIIQQTYHCVPNTLEALELVIISTIFILIFRQIHITTHCLTPHPDAIKVISACSQLGNRLLPRIDQLVDAARQTSHLGKNF